jgi:hypothetical protein
LVRTDSMLVPLGLAGRTAAMVWGEVTIRYFARDAP